MTYHKALIYSRLSNERADDSLDRMVRELQAFASQLGITVSDVIAEDDVSAWKTGDARKGRWSEVIDGLSAGRWDCLIVRSLDRCARDMIETIKLAQLREKIGFGFYALNGDTLGDEIIAAIVGWKNARESKDKSDRMKLKWTDRASKGEYKPGAWRPFGYHYNPATKSLDIDPVEADLVREAIERLISGESAHSIALDFDRRAIPTVSGRRWQRNMIVRLVKPTVAGLIEHGDEIYEGKHQAIVTREQYEAAKLVVTAYGTRPGHNARRHLLTGFLICASCGMKLVSGGGKNDRRSVYECSPRYVKATTRSCGRVSITKHNVEDLVVQLTLAYLSQQELEVQQQVDDLYSPAIQAAQEEVQAIQAAYEAGDITASQWIAGSKVARRKLADAEAMRTEQLAKLAGPNLSKLSGEDAAARWAALNLSQRRAVLGELFEAFVIKQSRRGSPFKPERIEVVWKS